MRLSVSAKRMPVAAAAIFYFAGVMLFSLSMGHVNAAQITGRSLTLSSSSTAASATTTYTFDFTVPTTTTNILSVGIDICTAADGTCTAPTGFSNASATLASQPTGLGDTTTWTIDASPPNANSLYITDSGSGTAPSGSQQIVFGNVQNPTTANTTFYARITTYSDAAWTPANAIDTGVTAASTTQDIILTGTMPESLVFCTGGTVNASCSTTTSGSVTFNKDFSPSTPAYATSQMAASTNALSGYAITVTGPTMSDGTNNITAIGGTATTSAPGTRQFGLNIVADTDAAASTPALSPASASVAPAADATNYFGEALANFNTDSNYAFNDAAANQIADSASNPTDGQVYTSTYMVNVSGNLPAGTYTTTLTYVCTPTF